MHIRCTEKELCGFTIWFDTQAGLKDMLPPGTTCLVESEIDEDDEEAYPEALFIYKWDGTSWQVLRDHKEHTRKATKAELESANDLTRKQVIEHLMLISPEGLDSPPYWKQQIYSNMLMIRSLAKYYSLQLIEEMRIKIISLARKKRIKNCFNLTWRELIEI